jgi:hypothetical protein
MRAFLRCVLLAGLAGILAGCGMNALLGEVEDDLANRPQSFPRQSPPAEASSRSMPVEAPRSAPPRQPRSELDGLPKLEPVMELAGTGADVSYFSAASVQRILDFYRRELPPRGWLAGKAQTDNLHYATMKFTRGKELMTVTLGLESSAVPPRVLVNLVPHGSMKVRELPRYPGTHTLFEEDYTAIYVTPEAIDKVYAKTMQLLQQAGWQERVGNGGGPVEMPEMKSFTLEKADLLLDVMISVAPAQGHKTTIQYTLRQKAKPL